MLVNKKLMKEIPEIGLQVFTADYFEVKFRYFDQKKALNYIDKLKLKFEGCDSPKPIN